MTAPSATFWRGKRVLLTGHTGFKGGWLSLWLQQLGAQVHGLSLPPATDPALFHVATIAPGMASSTFADIGELAPLQTLMQNCQPEIVLHLAAQPLVRLSYAEPVLTYTSNVLGTVHVLEACRNTPSVRAIVNVTSDKCYENREWPWAYREPEALGGHDPYSNSKACAELITQGYRQSYFSKSGPALATARAGNVIGGGDWSDDRLLPDILRAFTAREPVYLRHPQAIRPWQHVLEPLAGYLQLAERLYTEGNEWAEAWNFGPHRPDARPVQWIVEHLARHWGTTAQWKLAEGEHPHEAHVLTLDSTKASSRLQWSPRWSLERALDEVLHWHRAWQQGRDMQTFCLRQIDEYMASMPLFGY